jgi:hypothetical protein
MDNNKNFRIEPLPVEKEFRVLSVRQRLHQLSREDLEEFLAEALDTMTRLAHQVTQLRNYIEELEGKKELD